MGAQTSKNQTGIGYFSSEEVAQLKSEFNRISGGDKSGVCTAEQFQNHCQQFLDHSLAKKLTDKFSVKNQRGMAVVAIQEFLKFLSEILGGSIEDKSKCMVTIAGGKGATSLTNVELLQYAQSIIKSYLKLTAKSPQFRSWKISENKTDSEALSKLAESLSAEVLYGGLQGKDVFSKNPEQKLQFDLDEIVKGFSRAPLFFQLQATVFSECFSISKDQHVINFIPKLAPIKRTFAPEQLTILDMTQILFVNSQLPTDCQDKWRYLFSTAADGESFAKLLGAIQNQGATVIVLKEEKGHTFGAFVDSSWVLGPKFQGSEKCFLFHLNPKLMAYPSTGFNENFQYLNIQQQTLPNGLGLGGKLEYFGLWLDAEFGKGRSAPSCTTFSCPQLSVTEEFLIESLEVWGVGPPPVEEEGVRDPKSILDKDPEARAILDLMNKTAASDGYRDKKKSYEESDEDS